MSQDHEPALRIGTARALVDFWRVVASETDPDADASKAFELCADELERCLPGGLDGDEE